MASPAAVLTILVNASTKSAQAQLTALDRAGAATATTANRNALKTAASYEAAGKRISSVGRSMTRNISVPAAAAGAVSVKFAMDFEETMTKVQTLAGASRKQVKDWSDELLKLGPELGKSPRELADALYFVKSSGIAAKDALDVVTVSAKASASGLGETETVADAVTSAMNSYKKSGLSAADATDVLTQAVKFGKGEPAELAKSIGRVIPVASKLGVPFHDVGSSLAGLTLQGLDAAEATTALRAVFMSALHPSTQAADAMKGVGLSAEGLRKTLKDKGTLAMLNEVTTAFHGNVEEIGKVFPNVRALVGAFNLTGDSAGRNAKIFEAMGKDVNATGEAFAETAKTPAFQLHQALAQLESSAIQLGIVLLPIVADIVKEFAKLAKVIGGFPWATELLVFAIAIGPMTRLVGTIITLVGWYKKLAVAVGLANAAQAAGGASGAAGAAGGAASATTATGRTIGSTAGTAGMTAAGVTAGTAFAAAFAGVAGALIQEQLTNKMQEQAGKGFLGDAISMAGDLQEKLNKIGGGGPIGNIRTIIDSIKSITGPSKEAKDAAAKLDATLEGVGKRHEFFGPAEQAQMIKLAETAGKSDDEIKKLRAQMTAINKQSFGPLLAKYQDFRKQFQSGNDTIRSTGIANFRIMFRSMGNSANELRLKVAGLHDQINSKFADVRQAGIKNFKDLFSQAGHSTALLSAKSNALKQMLNSDFKDIHNAGVKQTKNMANEMGISWKDLASMIKGKSDDIRLTVFNALKALGLSDAAIQTEIGRRSTGAYSGGKNAKSAKGSGQTSVKPGGLQKGGMAKVPGSGTGDSYPVLAHLEPGEIFGVFNKKAAPAVEAMNKQYPRFGFQAGGSTGPLSATTTGRPGAMTAMARQAADLEVKAGNDLIQRMKKKMAPKGMTLGSGGGSWSVYDALAHRFGLSIASAFRPGAITDSGNASYHSMPDGPGRARATDYSNGYATHGELIFARKMAKKFGGSLRELIHTPLGFSIKDGARVAPYSTADHYDHVHVAFQKGGVQAYNKTYPTPGPAIPFNAAAAIAEKFGLPGITMAQVAKGESTLHPGARSPDGGMGLWQMTPSVQGASTVRRWNNIGSYYNPFNNAKMAKLLPVNGGTYHGDQYVTGWNQHYSGGLLGGGKGGTGKAGKTKTPKASRLLTELGVDINKLPLKEKGKKNLKHLMRRIPGLSSDADRWDELAQRAAAIAEDGKGVLPGGKDQIGYLMDELQTLLIWRNVMVLIHNILTQALETLNEQIAKGTGSTIGAWVSPTGRRVPSATEDSFGDKPLSKAKAKKLRKQGWHYVGAKKGAKGDVAALQTLAGQVNTKLGDTNTSLTDLQGTVLGGVDPFAVLPQLPAEGTLGGRIFDVQSQLKGARVSDPTLPGLTADQLKEMYYLTTLGVKFNQNAGQFAGMFAQGGTLGAGQWGIAGEKGPEAVVGPAAVVPGRGGAGQMKVLLEDHRTAIYHDKHLVREVFHEELDKDKRKNRRAYLQR